jgi:hypothetical protein
VVGAVEVAFLIQQQACPGTRAIRRTGDGVTNGRVVKLEDGSTAATCNAASIGGVSTVECGGVQNGGRGHSIVGRAPEGILYRIFHQHVRWPL